MPLIRKTPDAPTPAAAPPAQDVPALLASASPGERWAAARAATGAPGQIEALGRALKDERDPRVREAILTSLARIATPQSVDAVLPHLRSDDADLRTSALDALRAMPRAAATRLPALLQDPDPDVRLLACELARGLPTAEATALLCGLIEDEQEANVCAAAVEVLAETGGPEALPVLARCSVRFRQDPFLGFASRVAADRIGSQRGPRD